MRWNGYGVRRAELRNDVLGLGLWLGRGMYRSAARVHDSGQRRDVQQSLGLPLGGLVHGYARRMLDERDECLVYRWWLHLGGLRRNGSAMRQLELRGMQGPAGLLSDLAGGRPPASAELRAEYQALLS